MKNKRKQISNEISIRILSVVITIFVIFSIVVAIMIGNISLSSQKDELELQSKAASYQLETFFKKYTTTAEQMALNPDIREILTETKSGDSIKEATLYQDVFSVCSLSNLFFRFHTTTLTEACSNELKQHHL